MGHVCSIVTCSTHTVALKKKWRATPYVLRIFLSTPKNREKKECQRIYAHRKSGKALDYLTWCRDMLLQPTYRATITCRHVQRKWYSWILLISHKGIFMINVRQRIDTFYAAARIKFKTVRARAVSWSKTNSWRLKIRHTEHLSLCWRHAVVDLERNVPGDRKLYFDEFSRFDEIDRHICLLNYKL